MFLNPRPAASEPGRAIPSSTAGFRVDLGDWPVDGTAVALDVTCEVTGTRTLTCPDDVSSNPKFCPVVDTEPTYQFMIGSALD